MRNGHGRFEPAIEPAVAGRECMPRRAPARPYPAFSQPPSAFCFQ